jgi:methyltransferase family protein
MHIGYTVRAARTMLRHPRQGIERIRGRIDRRQDLRELAALKVSQREIYGVVENPARQLHEAIDASWPCLAASSFEPLWEEMMAALVVSGVRVGLASYGGWSDCDRALAQAVWCLVVHTRPAVVVETGVAHGVTSRVILEGLDRNGSGHLWSIDLPAVDPALHPEIGVAVPRDRRSRWTYVEGTSRHRLGKLLANVQGIDLFVHDSLHTARNLQFELGSVWPELRPGGAVVVDDVDHSLGFLAFIRNSRPGVVFTADKVLGQGLWGTAIKAPRVTQPTPPHEAH